MNERHQQPLERLVGVFCCLFKGVEKLTIWIIKEGKEYTFDCAYAKVKLDKNVIFRR